MLTRFEVSGFRAFSNPLVFDLASTSNYNFCTDSISNDIVSRGLIYGKNGSGKSSLGFALFDITIHLTINKSLDAKLLSGNYLNLDTANSKLAEFSYTFKFNNDVVVYSYGKRNPFDLVYEKLTINKNKAIDIDYRNLDKKYINLEGIKSLDFSKIVDNHVSIIKYIFANSVNGANTTITDLVNFANGMLWFRSLNLGNQYNGLTNGSRTLDEIIITANKLKNFEEFLHENGIKEKLSSEVINGRPTIMCDFKCGRTPLTSIASSGTISLWLYYSWMLNLDNVSFLFIDEFDAFYHYESAALVYKSIKKSKCLQAFVTTHDISLMNNELTRPDCCFLMCDGRIKALKDCTDKEIREGHNLEKMYRNGAFAC